MERYAGVTIGFAAGFGLVACLVGAPAAAAPITFGFTGTITEVIEDYRPGPPPPPTTVLDGSIAPGVGFTGQYTFDSNAVGIPQGSEAVRYTGLGGFVDVGNYRFTFWPSFWITVTDNTPGAGSDEYILASGLDIAGPVLPGCTLEGNDFRSPLLEDLDGSALSSTDLPLTPPPLPEFEIRALALTGYIDAPDGVNGDLEILGTYDTLFLIPEPATAGLIALGLVGLGMQRRRTR